MATGWLRWMVVGTAFLILFFSNGLTLQGLSAFDKILTTEFSWSLPAIKAGGMISLLIAGFVAPFVGVICDRFGSRNVLLAGVVSLSLGFLGYSQIHELWHLYVIHGILGLGMACAGILACVLVVSARFEARRGTAIGLALVGTSLGNSVLLVLNAQLLSRFPWRTVMMIDGLLPLCTVPFILFFVKEKQQKSTSSSQQVASNTQELPGMSYGEVMRSWRFWVLSTIGVFSFFSVLSVLSNLFLYLLSEGLPPENAAGMAAIPLMWALMGKFAFGFLADRFNAKFVFVANVGTMAIGAGLLLFLGTSGFTYAAALFGFGWGGLYTLLQFITVGTFGLKSAGRVLGTLTFLEAIGGALGPTVTAYLKQTSGGFQIPFTLTFVLLLTCFALSLLVAEPQKAAQPLNKPLEKRA